MKTFSLATPITKISKLFAADSSLPFKLLIVLLWFDCLRPDRIIPGGRILLNLPTLIMLVLLFLWIQVPEKKILNIQTKLLFGFLLVITLSSLVSRNKTWSFEQLRGFIIFDFIYYLMIVQFIDSSFKAEKYIKTLVNLSSFPLILGVFNKGLLPIPVLADENDFALFANFIFPLAYFLGQEADAKWKKIYYYLLSAICIISTIVSFSRGGLVGLVFVSLFLFYKSKYKILALFLFGCFAMVFFFMSSDSYWADMKTIFTEGSQEGTGKERIESWNAGWRMFLDHPILGVGPKNFGMWLSDYYIQYGSKGPEHMWGRAAHSVYFTLLPETGIAGTLIFFLILWQNFKNHKYIARLEINKSKLMNQANLTKNENDLVSVSILKLHYFSLGYCGAMIAFLSTGAFLSVLWYHYFWMLTAFWVMSTNAAKNIEQILLKHNCSKS